MINHSNSTPRSNYLLKAWLFWGLFRADTDKDVQMSISKQNPQARRFW